MPQSGFMMRLLKRLLAGCVCALGVGVATVTVVTGQQSPPQFGGGYAELDARRQQLGE